MTYIVTLCDNTML